MNKACTQCARWTCDGSPSGYSGKNQTGTFMDILPRYHELWATQDASFSRQTVACTTRTALQLACTSRRVGKLVQANTNAGPGNFHMKPNGVFYVNGEVAGILETRAFLKQRPQANFATQSGPMLVIDGKIHSRFTRYGGSRKYRSGVGSRDPNSLVVRYIGVRSFVWRIRATLPR